MNKVITQKIIWIFLGICLTISASATSGQAYLDKFMQYSKWSLHLPTSPDNDFISFINGTTPLSKKLREQWLYQLAYNKNWRDFNLYYKPSKDVNLQCYSQIALYQQGHRKEAVLAAKKLWLNGDTQPIACDQLFTLLLHDHEIDNALIYQRIVLALEKNNISLTNYLLRQYSPPRLSEIQLLQEIVKNPKKIARMGKSELHSEFYLYGLKRMVNTNLSQAMPFWQLARNIHFLNPAQQQTFMAYAALYEAMRDHQETLGWFNKVNPAFYNDTLIGWQIRYSLKYKQWQRVEYLINQIQEKEAPCWQYWLARSLEGQGKKEKATTIYESLAKTRNYYGFLASHRLKTAPNFENERTVTNKQILKPYQSITDKIHALYVTKQTMQASRLLNDFMSELPKDDKSALLYWLSNDLQWHGKAVFLSSNKQLNNQLFLRFPLAYEESVKTYAKNYQIPKELIYAIIRQESGFRDDVVSPAGAHGLMQIMPATAKSISKNKKITYVDKKQLFSSQKNIQIGTAYLQQLNNRFHQHPILVAAAYNAGPKQANYWMKNHPPEEIDIWIETLPWKETRNYLKNIIAFYAVYQYRMQQKSDLSPFMKHF